MTTDAAMAKTHAAASTMSRLISTADCDRYFSPAAHPPAPSRPASSMKRFCSAR
jgi:hypothetical protein